MLSQLALPYAVLLLGSALSVVAEDPLEECFTHIDFDKLEQQVPGCGCSNAPDYFIDNCPSLCT